MTSASPGTAVAVAAVVAGGDTALATRAVAGVAAFAFRAADATGALVAAFVFDGMVAVEW
jgi:hypothetical protein